MSAEGVVALDTKALPTWEFLLKQMIWEKLDFVCGKKVLDYGSGYGITANHLAEKNEVTAIEPSGEMLAQRISQNPYTQIHGGLDELKALENGSFDVIVCHCVLEYIDDKEEVIREFARILVPGGYMSIVKHNRAGRIMQMTVLLNNFTHANELLDGENGNSPQYGDIKYYEDDKLCEWLGDMEQISHTGLRTFWHLQQNQDIQKDKDWQRKMLAIEKRVSDKKEFMDIAMFHHLIFRKSI